MRPPGRGSEGIVLHFFRGGEAQNVNALFQHILGKTDQGNVARLLERILLAQNPGLMVELVDASGKFIDIGADQVGGRSGQGTFQGRGKFGNGNHQILGPSCRTWPEWT